MCPGGWGGTGGGWGTRVLVVGTRYRVVGYPVSGVLQWETVGNGCPGSGWPQMPGQVGVWPGI